MILPLQPVVVGRRFKSGGCVDTLAQPGVYRLDIERMRLYARGKRVAR